MKRTGKPAQQNRFRHILLGILVVLALSVQPDPAHVLAETSIQIEANEHTVVFGQHIRFHLQVSSTANIQSIVLAYRTTDTQGTNVQRMTFDPARTISVDYIHEIEQRYVRPFVELMYWWTIEDGDQNRLITPSQTFVYADNRFDWQTLAQDSVRIHWYQGEIEVAQTALNKAVVGLDRARQDIYVEGISKAIDIYMYANANDLNVALPLPTQSEALTVYETNTILTSFAPETAHMPKIERILPHEVTHALLHEVTQSDLDRVPTWLAEGLATSVEYAFVPNPDANLRLAEAIQRRETLSFSILCAGFSTDPVQANLAYAQSASLINYIRDVYGRQALRDLVAAYADGATCDGGVQRVLNMSLERLNHDWLDTLSPRSMWAAFWIDNAAWLILLVLLIGVPFLFALPHRTRVRQV
ncbi:MAG: hypothetical protein JW934_20820 [Anaerolineae bacterium]|nr:hypothetical protein [Anaerolineae bacterium]